MRTLCLSLPAACIAAFWLAMPCSAFRPFKTDDAGTVPSGCFELETAVDYWRDKAAPGFSLAHGVTNRMDLGVSFGRCLLPHGEHGYDGLHVGLKCALVPDLLAASFCGTFSDPSYGGSLIMSKPFPFFSLHAAIGFEATAATDDADLTCGIAGVSSFGRLSAGLEINGTQKGPDWLQAALLYEAAPWLIIDFGLGGHFRSSHGLTATTGLFFAFPAKKDQ